MVAILALRVTAFAPTDVASGEAMLRAGLSAALGSPQFT